MVFALLCSSSRLFLFACVRSCGCCRADAQANRAQMWKTRYHELERRRALEVEGYKTDIKMLRSKMKELEKSMYKLVLHDTRGDEEHTKV